MSQQHDPGRSDAEQRDLEHGLRSLYEDAPALPVEVVHAALDRSANTRQRRFGPIPMFALGGRRSAIALVRPIAAALVLVAAGFALASFLAEPRDSSVVPAATRVAATPAPSATIEAAAAGARIVVAQDGSGDVDTIAAALELASAGDTLLIQPGTYVGGVTLAQDVTIRGDGAREAIVVTATAETPTIDLDETLSYAILIQDSNATVRGLSLRNAGAPAFAPIVAVGGAPTIEDVDAGGTIRLADASDATVRGNRMAGLEMTGELGDPRIADNITIEPRADVEAALAGAIVAGQSLEGCSPWREPDEPFSFGSTGAIRCGEPEVDVSQLALFAFDDAASLDRFWQWRIDGLGIPDTVTGIDCGTETTGIGDWEHGSIVCYADPSTGGAKIRWTDRRDMTYGVVDATGADIEPVFRMWQEQTQQ